MKNCIAALTRGYTDISYYSNLIRRNKQINENLINKDTDCLIFHEGNIPEDHQAYIKSQSPELHLLFINVNNGLAFHKEKESIPHSLVSRGWGDTGYRHMCAFWFAQFLDFTKEYEKVLRIDEDCYISFSIEDQFKTLDHYIFVCGRWIKEDVPSVTGGLLDISISLFKCEPRAHYGPYTNVTGYNVQKIRESKVSSPVVNEFIDKIYKSDGIYKERWGDHILWGELIMNFYGMDSIKISTLHYFHASHNLQL